MGQKRGTGIQSSAKVVNFEGLVGVFDVHLDWVDHFEGWLKDILPNVKPGLKNAHMYKKYQIWPSVRDWRSDEISHIPNSLSRYLGSPGIFGK